MYMDEDTQRLAGGFRTLETKLRMIKERRDKTKYDKDKFWEVLRRLDVTDGFSEEEIEFFKAMNRLSGSLGHGNYAEAIKKIDEEILPKYCPDLKPKKGQAKKIDLSECKTGEDILNAIQAGPKTPVIPNRQSDIYESYIAAKADGYIAIMDALLARAKATIDRVLDQGI